MPGHFENCSFLNKREKQVKLEHKLQSLGEREQLRQLELLKVLSSQYDCPLHAEL